MPLGTHLLLIMDPQKYDDVTSIVTAQDVTGFSKLLNGIEPRRMYVVGCPNHPIVVRVPRHRSIDIYADSDSSSRPVNNRALRALKSGFENRVCIEVEGLESQSEAGPYFLSTNPHSIMAKVRVSGKLLAQTLADYPIMDSYFRALRSNEEWLLSFADVDRRHELSNRRMGLARETHVSAGIFIPVKFSAKDGRAIHGSLQIEAILDGSGFSGTLLFGEIVSDRDLPDSLMQTDLHGDDRRNEKIICQIDKYL